MSDIPKYIIIGLEPELQEFKRVVCDLNMPIVDIASCVQQIFSIMSIMNHPVIFEEYLNELVKWMGKGEGLYENARLDPMEQTIVSESVYKFTIALRDKLSNLNAIMNNEFPYKFYMMLGNNSVVLEYDTN